MFGASWKYSLGRKFNVKWSIMHTYHTILTYLLTHHMGIPPYAYLPYLLMGVIHYAILTILTYGIRLL